MDVLVHSLLARVGLGAGFATLSGMRAFLPLSLVGLVSRLDLFESVEVEGTTFSLLENPLVIGALVFLALLEITADKVGAFDSALDMIAMPFRILAGSLLFGVAVLDETTVVLVAAIVAGGGIAGAAHGAKSSIRSGAAEATSRSAGATAEPPPANPFLSFFEDVAAAVGTALLIVLPILGLLFLAFLLFLVYRIARRRRRRGRGLRILEG